MGLNKLSVVLLLAVLGACAAAPKLKLNRALELAETCNEETCIPPACRCSRTQLNEEFEIETIPQLVMLTFDDAVTVENSIFIREGIDGRVNPDGSPAAATFFVSHEYTDYSVVHNHWANGHEIALHSISHSPLISYWQNLSVPALLEEFGGQRELMAHFARIPIDEITGMRLPLFELSGNNTYEVLRDIGLTYDSSWPTQHYIAPGMWPYTLDYASTQDCPIGNCPTAALPGVWVSPILNWEDTEGYKCAMVDACSFAPEDEDEIVDWLISNFNRSYTGNRAPFGVYIHAAWFGKAENHFNAYTRFLDYMNEKEDVFFVSTQRAVEYTQNPRTLAEGPFENHQGTAVPNCTPKLCQLVKQVTGEERWMTQCLPDCPAVYPWLGNPLGEILD